MRRDGAVRSHFHWWVFGKDKGNKIILGEKYSSRFEDTFVSQKCVTHLSHAYVVFFRLFASPLPYVGRGQERVWMSGMEGTTWEGATMDDRKSPTASERASSPAAHGGDDSSVLQARMAGV